MLGFAEAARRSIRTMWLTLLVGLLGLLALFGAWLINVDRAFSDEYGSSTCKRGELSIPNGADLVANVRRTACAPAFAPDDIDYFVFVHRAGEHDEKAGLVFHYHPDNYSPFPVITPRVFWSDTSSLHVALSSSPVAPSSKTPRRLTYLRGVHIIYDTAYGEPKEVVAPMATHSRSAHVLSVPVWSKLHSGMKVYFGDDPVDGPRLTVCPSIEAYNYVRIKSYSAYNTDATIGTSR